MIIDAHNHPDWHKHNLERFIANMDRFHIDKTWLLTWIAPESEYDPEYNHIIPHDPDGPISFQRAYNYKQAAPDRFILGYAPDPRTPDAMDRLQAAVELYGVQVYGELKLRMMYDNPDAIRIFRYCGSVGLPVTVHLDYCYPTGHKYPRPDWWYGGGIEPFERAIQACPETNFIGHAPGFWAHISGDDAYLTESYPNRPVLPGGKVLQMMDTYPNLYADLSAGSARNALTRDINHGREFLIRFADRLLYARDNFDNAMQDLLNGLDLPQDVAIKLYAGNAQKLLARQA